MHNTFIDMYTLHPSFPPDPKTATEYTGVLPT